MKHPQNQPRIFNSSRRRTAVQSADSAAPITLRRYLTDALIIAAVSVIGYVLAYSFETGFARQFGYPKYLIELSTANIAYALTITAIAVAAMFNLFWVYRTTNVGTAPRYLWTLAGVGVVALSAQLVLGGRSVGINVIWLVVAILYFSRRLFRRRYDALSPDPVLRKAMAGILVFVVMANAFFGARGLGSFQARTQQNFYALQDDPTMLVVRMYGANLVAVRYDPAKRQFTNEMKVFRLEDKASMTMVRIVIDQRNGRRVSTLGTAYD